MGLSQGLWPAANLTGVPIQAKLTIGQERDKYEQEADQVAKEVVPLINKQSVGNILQQSGEEKMRSPVLSKSRLARKVQGSMGVVSGAASPEFERRVNRARGGGRPLDAAFRAKVEPLMGADFSGVRVHTDGEADRLSRSIQAKAFTSGQDVFFSNRAYEPMKLAGQEMLAHELTHVIQQKGGDGRMQGCRREKAHPGISKESRYKRTVTSQSGNGLVQRIPENRQEYRDVAAIMNQRDSSQQSPVILELIKILNRYSNVYQGKKQEAYEETGTQVSRSESPQLAKRVLTILTNHDNEVKEYLQLKIAQEKELQALTNIDKENAKKEALLAANIIHKKLISASKDEMQEGGKTWSLIKRNLFYRMDKYIRVPGTTGFQALVEIAKGNYVSSAGFALRGLSDFLKKQSLRLSIEKIKEYPWYLYIADKVIPHLENLFLLLETLKPSGVGNVWTHDESWNVRVSLSIKRMRAGIGELLELIKTLCKENLPSWIEKVLKQIVGEIEATFLLLAMPEHIEASTKNVIGLVAKFYRHTSALLSDCVLALDRLLRKYFKKGEGVTPPGTQGGHGTGQAQQIEMQEGA
ncbi:MAG: DUF4157 domain-containing protein [Symploca sp. SIO2E6]|nr:DUF4157 domain-containing protein [Symploca sp. SIO2E6]